MEYTMALCESRHPIPGVERAIFPNTITDPTDLGSLMEIAASAIPSDCTELTVYVTGLTVAMLAVVRLCLFREISLTAMHYDRENGTYYQQDIVRFDDCPFCGGRINAFNYACPHCGST